MNARTQLLRVQNFMLSADGYGTGEGQSIERPFGHADPGALAAWAGATASWPNRTDEGGTRGLDDYFTRDFTNNIGAEIMGRSKFGPQQGRWEDLDEDAPRVPRCRLHRRHARGRRPRRDRPRRQTVGLTR